MNGTQVVNPNTAGLGNVGTQWSIVGAADFNGDGNPPMRPRRLLFLPYFRRLLPPTRHGLKQLPRVPKI
jgi:hypothetical protein